MRNKMVFQRIASLLCVFVLLFSSLPSFAEETFTVTEPTPQEQQTEEAPQPAETIVVATADDQDIQNDQPQAEETEAPQEPQTEAPALAQTSALKNTGDSALFGVMLTSSKKNGTVEFTDENEYSAIAVTGTYKKNAPTVSRISADAPDGVTVLEAWAVDGMSGNTALEAELTLNALPETAWNEEIAVYSVKDGRAYELLADAIDVGGSVRLSLKHNKETGIALVKVGTGETLAPDSAIWANDALYLTGKMPGNAVVEATPVSVEIDGRAALSAYDIKIYANANQQAKGKPWKPAADKVTVHFYNADFNDAKGTLSVYHMETASDAPELVADNMTADNGWIEFDAASFSVYAVAGVIEKDVQIGNDVYHVTVEYDSDSGVPDGVILEVREIQADTDAYAAYRSRAAETLNLSENSIVFARVLDISLKDPETLQDIPLNSSVRVSVELKQDVFQEDADIAVVHFAKPAAAPLGNLNIKKDISLPGQGTASINQSQGSAPATDASVSDYDDVPTLVASTVSGNTVAFDTDGFSVYVVMETVLNKTVTTGDGETYDVQVTYGADAGIPMEGTELLVEELLPGSEEYEVYILESAETVGVDVESIEMSHVFDIRIVDENDHGHVYEPTGPVTVSMRLIGEALEEYENVNVLHFAQNGEADGHSVYTMESAVSGEEITFVTDSFSIYAVITTPKNPYVGGWMDAGLEMLETKGETQGFYLSHDRYYLMNNVVNATSTRPRIQGTRYQYEVDEILTGEEEKTKYYFKYVNDATNSDGDVGKLFKIYYKDSSNNPYYVVMNYTKDDSAGLSFDTNENNATVFFIFPANDYQYLISGTVNNHTYYWNRNTKNDYPVYGAFSGYYNKKDTNVAKIEFHYYQEPNYTGEPYGIDGQSFSIAYHEESVTASGLTTEGKTVSGQNRLIAEDMLVQPNVVSNDGELLVTVNEMAELPVWKFSWTGTANEYCIITDIGGEDKYLSVSEKNLTIGDTPTVFTVDAGVGEYSGKYRFSVNGYSVALMGGTTSNGFVGSNDAGKYAWLNLVSRTNYTTESFQAYSAQKVSIATHEEDRDLDEVKNGDSVVIYTRAWNENKKKYEYYVINHDGSLLRCYESGDMIQWVSNAVNSVVWDFTEYYYADGVTPNNYYELQNQYSHKFIAPQVTGGQILSDSTIGVNLNGRRNGNYFSTILAWDDQAYTYAGLKVENGRLVSCPIKEAMDFYFAKLVDYDVSELTEVETIDNNRYGITMKIANFPSDEAQFVLLGNRTYNQWTGVKNLLSTNIDKDTNYPTGKNGSLSSLYNSYGLKTVNHLFISSTYFSSGYYEYDSTQNFATLIQDDGTVGSDFTVYNQLGTQDVDNKPSVKHGQFLPFNGLTTKVSKKNPENLYDALLNELPDSNPRKGEELLLVNGAPDFYFGVELEASFVQTPSGHDAWGHDIIYEFTGDDDFWLYVDGELIIDLGGIHSAISGSVNYHTGIVNENGRIRTLRQIFEENYRARKGNNVTDDEVNAYLAQYFNDGEIIFKDYTSHTMRIFYMERGAGASNLHMRFNLASVRPGTVQLSKEITGVENADSYTAEYPFQVYYKLSDEENAPELRLKPNDNETNVQESEKISVFYKDSTRRVTYKATYTASDNKEYNDVFMLRPGETAEIKFPDSAMLYRVVECNVDTSVYDEVYVNDHEETVTPLTYTDRINRADYSIDYDAVRDRTRVIYKNHVDPAARHTLQFTKKLFDEAGNKQIHYSPDLEPFSFRLYLGTENTDFDHLTLADMYNYHVKDPLGHYCTWNGAPNVQKFESLTYTVFDDNMPDDIKEAATFHSSMNGSISKIPVDYTVEVLDITPGTKYKVEERRGEIPDGYGLRDYTINGTTNGTTPPQGEVTENVNIVINNLKGWGLRVNKTWTDADYMADRDPVYFAVYLKENNNSYTLVDGTVQQMRMDDELTKKQTTLYWFFAKLKDGYSFDQYTVWEVTPENPNVDSDGFVTNYDKLKRLEKNNTFNVQGTQKGDSSPTTFTYIVQSVDQGTQQVGTQVRQPSITNKRKGIELYKEDMNGTPLSGAVFTLKDAAGNDAGAASYTSDDGLITIAYLREDEDYTLEEIASPAGYQALQPKLTITRSSTGTVTVTGEDQNAFTYTVSSSDADDYFAKVYIKNKSYTLQVRKTNASKDQGLSGISFALYRQVMGGNGQPMKDMNPVTGFDNVVSGDDGFISAIEAGFRDGTLKPGTYYLEEIKTPETLAMYRPLDSDVIFTVSPTGEVSLGSAPTGVELRSPAASDDPKTYTIIVPNDLLGKSVIRAEKKITKGNKDDFDGKNTFSFKATVYMPDGVTKWPYNDDGFSNGELSFRLDGNQSAGSESYYKTFTVPVGAIVTVMELANSEYDLSLETDNKNNNNISKTGRMFRINVINDSENYIIRFKNSHKEKKINVYKKVTGSGGTFTFTLETNDLPDGYQIISNPKTLIQAGKATFTITVSDDGQVMQALGIVQGSEVTITEITNSLYTTSYRIGDKGTIQNGNSVSFTSEQTQGTVNVYFINEEIPKYPAPTGYGEDAAPFAVLLASGALLALVAGLRRRKRRE